MRINDPKLVVIGGGSGSYQLLKAFKGLSRNITAIVNMSDNGGSSGVLRNEFGVLPPGDIRQCLVALSNASEELQNLFNFRFGEGSLAGHPVGNLFLSAAEKMTADFNEAVRLAADVLQVSGQVVPVTLEPHQLVLVQDQKKIVGEYEIANTSLSPRPEIFLEPQATANQAALQSIAEADLIVIAPGNLYGSLIPALVPQGMAAALADTSAKVVHICNLVNIAKQTPDFMVHDYVREIERFTTPGVVDFVLYNTDIPDDDLLQRYARHDEYPVLYDQAVLDKATYEAIPGNYLARSPQASGQNDTRITRSLIRHDGEAISHVVMQLLE